ncbi:MAG TPA: universal stress protein [Halococcus sp.]|nr:universal stress protein [Halococcus sp.]
MQRALAVVEPDEHTQEMVREAAELAEGVGAELVLLHVTTEEEFHDNQEQLSKASTSGAGMYNVEKAQEGAQQYAQNVANELLSDLDVAVTPVGKLGERREEILSTDEEYDCDYVFITGRKRSPTGKALFGDDAQAIVLNFEGKVVIETA